ncbi:hypothetical protein STEG23_033081, partial [Scotinomys teguina]
YERSIHDVKANYSGRNDSIAEYMWPRQVLNVDSGTSSLILSKLWSASISLAT